MPFGIPLFYAAFCFALSELSATVSIFSINSVAAGGISHQHVRYRADKLAVLDYRAARQ